MEEHIKQAIEITKAQASVRVMGTDEIHDMILGLATTLKSLADGAVIEVPVAAAATVDPKNAIREKSVICVECGKPFKVLTKRHLATHGLTPDEYRAKWGYKKDTSLVAKGLARSRRKTMQDMKLWERKAKPVK